MDDEGRKTALHKELQERLSVFIADASNEMLPSERELMARFDISRTTVRRAIQTLVAEGKVQPVHGKGNVIVRSAARKTGKILLLLKENAERYQLEAFSCLLGALSDAGLQAISMIVRSGEPLAEKAAAVLNEVDGAVLADWLSEDTALHDLLVKSGKRVAVLRHKPVNFSYDFAAEDKADAFRQLVLHLASLGHKRIAFVSYLKDALRMKGLRQGFEEAGLEIDERLFIDSAGWTASGFASTDVLLQKKLPFSAVIAQNDECALGVMQRLMLSGVRVPEDVSLVGYDNLKESASYPIPLTTCGGDLPSLCRAVVAFLLSPEKDAKLALLVKPELAVRKSSAAAPAR